MAKKENCSTCRFSRQKWIQLSQNNLESGQVIKCYRYAPKPDTSMPIVHWPVITNNDWCGEYESG